jgi:hypothetical protein
MNAGTETVTVTVPLGPDVHSGKVGDSERVLDAMMELLDGGRVPVTPVAGGVGFTVTLQPLTGRIFIPHLSTSFPSGG